MKLQHEIAGSLYSLKVRKSRYRILNYRQLILENFVPIEDRNKIRNRGIFDDDAGEWSLKPLTSQSS